MGTALAVDAPLGCGRTRGQAHSVGTRSRRRNPGDRLWATIPGDPMHQEVCGDGTDGEFQRAWLDVMLWGLARGRVTHPGRSVKKSGRSDFGGLLPAHRLHHPPGARWITHFVPGYSGDSRDVGKYPEFCPALWTKATSTWPCPFQFDQDHRRPRQGEHAQ